MKLTDVFEQTPAGDQVGYPASEIIDRIRATDRSILAIYHGLQAMGYEGIGPSAQKQIIEPYAEEISAYWNEMLSANPRNRSVIAQGLRLLSLGIRWPGLQSVLENNKDSILWYILSRVKESVERDRYEGRTVAKNVITLLEEIGITWPELTIIKNSLNDGKNISENTVPANVQDEIYQMLERSVKRMGIWYVITRMVEWEINFDKVPQVKKILDNEKTNIIHKILTNVKAGDLGFANRRIGQLFDIGVDWPELQVIRKSILTDRAKKVAEPVNETAIQLVAENTQSPNAVKITGDNLHFKLREMITAIDNHDSESADPIFFGLSNFWILYQVLYYIWLHVSKKSTATWFFDLHKTAIIRHLLQEIKEDSGHAPQILTLLQRSMVGWPELAIVERSLYATKNLKETDFATYYDAARDLSHGLQSGDLKSIATNLLYLISRYGLDSTLKKYLDKLPTSKLVKILNTIKTPILKYLDNQMSSNKQKAIISLELLRKLKLNWPELNLLAKMNEAVADDLDNEEEDYEEDDELREYLDNLWWEITSDMRRGSVFQALGSIKTYLKSGGRHKQVLKLINNNKEKIVSAIQSEAERGSHGLMGIIKDIRELGIDWLELTDDNVKPFIIKGILKLIKRENYRQANTSLRSLRKHDIKWPELDVIEKSLASTTTID